jgi:hypothetical protein
LTALVQPGPEFRQLFHSFEHTAYRLEARDDYDASYERESLRKFLAGEPDDLPWMQSWYDMLREATAKGRRFARVRVVMLPLSEGAGEIVKHNFWRDAAWHHAVRRDDFVIEQQLSGV